MFSCFLDCAEDVEPAELLQKHLEVLRMAKLKHLEAYHKKKARYASGISQMQMSHSASEPSTLPTGIQS